MLDVYLAATISIVVALLLIDLFVISKNSKAQINRVFFIAVLFLSAWILSNYYSNDFNLSNSAALLANHLVLFFSSLLVYYLASFVALLCSLKFYAKHPALIAAINYSVAFLTLTPLVIKDISRQESVYAISFGQMAYLYFVLLIINAGIIAYSLIRGLRKSSGLERNRIQTVFWSLITTLVVILITNAGVPLITGSFSLTNIGPLFSIIFVAGVAYSIVRHRLFDIRAVVARSVAYLLLLATLLGIFIAGIFGITSIFFSQDKLGLGIGVVFAIMAVAIAFALPPLKRFFDRVTNQLFYRDAYEPQELLNDLNRSLVTTIDFDELLKRSSKIINNTLKSEYCAFAIKQQSVDQIRLISTHQLSASPADLEELIKEVSKGYGRVILADELDGRHAALKQKLAAYNISSLIKLEGQTAESSVYTGLIILGQKRSGNIYSAQDIRILEIIADELTIAIQNSLRFEEIQRFNVTLQEKIDEATKQLRSANHRLKELDQTKDEFISMASHQLRTPLTTIKGYLSMVLEGDVGPVSKDEKKMIQQAFDSAERMVFLISDLLNVSRLQSGKFVIENKPTDLAKMVEDEVDQLQDTAKNHHLTLTYKKPANFPLLNLDETKIRQVIMNFMDNAIFYTPAEGSITVALETTDDAISYTVTDTGLGVPKSEQHHLFSKFYRAGNARKMRPDGTGLGLFMAKKVIVAQGGGIIFKSEEGKGSTFGFSFPRSKVELKGKAPEKPKAETVAAK